MLTRVVSPHYQAVQETGARLIQESDINTADIQERLEQLARSWDELKDMAKHRWVVGSDRRGCVKYGFK